MIALLAPLAFAAPIALTARTGGGLGFYAESSAGRVNGHAAVFTALLDLEAGTGSLVVDPASLSTSLGPRDQRMLVYALEVPTQPELRFDVTRAWPHEAAEGQWSLSGTLKLHGVALPLVVPVTVSHEGTAVRVQGEMQLTLSDFAIPDPSVVLARFAPTVTVTFDLIGETVEETAP